MTTKNAGKKHILLLYHRTMDRLWGITLVLGLVLVALWWFGGAFTDLLHPGNAALVLAAAGIALAVGVFAFLARRMGYVQAHADYFVLATPFFRLKTSYRRVRSIRTTEFFRLFDVDNLKWSEESYLKPFVGESTVVVGLTDYPVSPRVIKLFFPNYILSPKGTEYVLLVPEWMGLSVELDSRYNEYRQRNRRRQEKQGFQRGSYR